MNEYYKTPNLELLGLKIKKNKILAIFGYIHILLYFG